MRSLFEAGLPRSATSTVHRFWLIVTCCITALLGFQLPSAAPLSNQALRMLPSLAELATVAPNQSVQVIIQANTDRAALTTAVRQLGGVITTELNLINGMAASVPAWSLLTLARRDDVDWISPDAPIKPNECNSCLNESFLKSAYPQAIGASKLWNEAQPVQGQGVTVAVIDSGINPFSDFYTVMGVNRLIGSVRFNSGYNQSVFDAFGHGNHVAGIVGGNGRSSNGAYIGVAPASNLLNIKVTDNDGSSMTSNLIAALEWINNNKTTYNIRVVNLSMNSNVNESYHVNPLDAALEVLWFNGIVVVVSAGNNGGPVLPPANDPYVITVGAIDDKGTANVADDMVPTFSSYGQTLDGFAKPDLVAPGVNLVSYMGGNGTGLAVSHADHIVDSVYFRMSGTSMSSAVVAGAVALLLQDEPTLTPDQVKYRLMSTARPLAGSTNSGAGALDAYAAVHGTSTATSNNNIPMSQLAWQWTGHDLPSWYSYDWSAIRQFSSVRQFDPNYTPTVIRQFSSGFFLHSDYWGN